MADDSANIIRHDLEEHKDNSTALKTIIAPPWVSPQNIRSTDDILWSCILTLTACIYTALHLNISRKPCLKKRLWSKVRWVFIAIIAPEAAVYMAFSQWLEARQLVKKLNEERKREEEINNRDVPPKFGLTYGFFIVMGGLRVSYDDTANDNGNDGTCNPWTPSDNQTEYWSQPNSTKTLSPEAVVALAKNGVFLYVSEESIADRSKADSIQKALVVLQVSWMFLQCVARKAYQLPLTLLEVHTMAHILCAGFMYACWFKKPLDVFSPEVLRYSSFNNLPRTSNLSSSLTSQNTWNILTLLLFEDMTRHSRSHPDNLPVFLPLEATCRQGNNGDPTIKPDEQDVERTVSTIEVGSRFGEEDTILLQQGEVLPIQYQSGDFLASHLQPNGLIPCGFQLNSINPGGQVISRKDYLMLQRVVAAMNAIQGGPISAPVGFPYNILINNEPTSPPGDSEDPPDRLSILGDRSNLFGDATIITITKAIFPVELNPYTFAGIHALPGIYGAIHLPTMNSEFPSDSEWFIWKLSCLVIMVLLPCAIQGELCLGLYVYESVKRRITMILLITITIARIYIIVEAFISLRHVPIGVYQTPAWLSSK
ncbi:hypothetical protein F5Y00DRAFT_263484 [Daldinia vernicosa]|uniref:uncharacterized protein n=1 Tax=Daldinia vernicosa TaxID=114800 RepID=UPI0020089F75|nr:uncharacterized protein F5Y00DRAFT_263484 [Daldinia vernicosa]KAI0847574.1 hypothetical protein F5Y00DRAFT_263484 [Daldinia vernicosa]